MIARAVFYLSLFSVFLSSCQSDGGSDLQPLDLMQYNIPLTIQAPDSVNVKTMDLVVQKDVTVRGATDENYYVQIYASDAATNDLAQAKAEQLSEVKSNRYFSKIVEEEDAGFIYENKIDSTTNYGFRYIHLQGDQQYVFQTGLIGNFTQESAKRMYDAVQQGK